MLPVGAVDGVLPSHLNTAVSTCTNESARNTPQSKSQTSPRRMAIFFSFEHRGHFVPGQGDIVVIEWPGIKAGEPTEDFPRDGLFLRTRQRIKSGDHAFGDCAHCNKFSGQPSTCHLEPVEAFEP